GVVAALEARVNAIQADLGSVLERPHTADSRSIYI
ncbi:MAG: hypothetical protein ACI9TI_000309, partial [Natronomonas sp.]